MRYIKVDRLEYLYYVGRLDFVPLNAAMLFFYAGLREHLPGERKAETASAAVKLPLFPIVLTDMVSNGIFIVLSIMSLRASVQLYRTERDNVLWNYMVWLASAWFMFSVSRSFGHIMRHVLIPMGHEDARKVLEPFAGSFNTVALFFVGSVSLFFIRINGSYMQIASDKLALERLVAERTNLIERLERDKTELRELDKLESAFLANISHELRTPMNTIIGYAEALLDRIDGPLNEEQERSLVKVRQSAAHLLTMIDDLLDVSKLESAKLRLSLSRVDLKPLIEGVAASFEKDAGRKGLSLSIVFPEAVPVVYGDADKIKQILVHLVSNAVKFTRRGGITITVRNLEEETQLAAGRPFVEMCVADTGMGMKEDDLKRIFEKFVQVDFTLERQFEGAVIGLSIARGLVERHKGKIWATSKYGEGSTFCFTLPVRKEIFGDASLPL